MFRIEHMGCDYHHDEDFYIERRSGYDFYLALFIRNRCVIGVDENMAEYEANTFVLFDRNSPQYYGACHESYTDDWIVFSADDDFAASLNIAFGEPVHIGDRFDLDGYYHILQSLFFRGVQDDAVVYHLMMAMLLEISACKGKIDLDVPHMGKLLKLRSRIYAEPQTDWSIGLMADELHVSNSYLQEIYRKAFGVSCISDVIASRVSMAKELLVGTDKTVEEICTACGYNNIVHFSRQFKKHTGLAPSVWRKNGSGREQ